MIRILVYEEDLHKLGQFSKNFCEHAEVTCCANAFSFDEEIRDRNYDLYFLGDGVSLDAILKWSRKLTPCSKVIIANNPTLARAIVAILGACDYRAYHTDKCFDFAGLIKEIQEAKGIILRDPVALQKRKDTLIESMRQQMVASGAAPELIEEIMKFIQRNHAD